MIRFQTFNPDESYELLPSPGGHDGNEFLDTVEMYDPVTDVWTSIPNMTRARNGAGAAVIGDNLYAIG